MAIMKAKDMLKMTEKEIREKINELRVEMIKAKAASKKSGKSNLREIKKTIARLMTTLTLNKLKAKEKKK